MHAESLVRAENQPQPTINHVATDPLMMMDIGRDGSAGFSTKIDQSICLSLSPRTIFEFIARRSKSARTRSRSALHRSGGIE